MQISNSNVNLNAMRLLENQTNENAQKTASIAAPNSETGNQEVTQDLIDTITNQIPVTIAYEANANAIKTKNAVSDVLLNLKA